MSNLNIKGILFDFGGTLDTDGVHWSEEFWAAYVASEIAIAKKDYEKAYVQANESMLEGLIKPSDSFLTTIGHQIRLQLEYLIADGKIDISKKDIYWQSITNHCYNHVQSTISGMADFLAELSRRYQLVLVSNYYGNIENVLLEFNIRQYFKGVIDSGTVGIRKPDPAIWMMGVELMSLKPEDCLVVGDSYTRDIVPAKKIGCYTAWIDGKSFSVPEQTSDADFIIKSNYSLKPILL